MNILDITAGFRGIWFDKTPKDTIFMDIRKETNPDICADVKNLPFKSQVFDLVVFDPPHVNFGKNAELSKRYGYFTSSQIRESIIIGFMEIARILKPTGICTFKWNDHDVKLKTILDQCPWVTPLFGHRVATRTKHSSSTYWVCLRTT